MGPMLGVAAAVFSALLLHCGAVFEDGKVFDFVANREYQIRFLPTYFDTYETGVSTFFTAVLPVILQSTKLSKVTLHHDLASDETTESFFFDTADRVFTNSGYELRLINSFTYGTSTFTLKHDHSDPQVAFAQKILARSSEYKFKLKNEMDIHPTVSRYARSLKLDDPENLKYNASVTSVKFLHKYFDHVDRVVLNSSSSIPLESMRHHGKRAHSHPASMKLRNSDGKLGDVSLPLDIDLSVQYRSVPEALTADTVPHKVEFSFKLKYEELMAYVPDTDDYASWVEASMEVRDLILLHYSGVQIQQCYEDL
eukprot:TRINITY_DN1331_c0_g1_i1.p1 TRINITY_DN1331_c0_g1~~TRINITY_DN1331_c0_g1_i1.p1  ORF type:complete len:311 (+),score=76.01 TRINITY_DN1331_c0_g1_i1:86-1018(+)